MQTSRTRPTPGGDERTCIAHPKRGLALDDVAELRSFVQGSVTRAGTHVTALGDLVEALPLAAGEPLDVVAIDIDVPVPIALDVLGWSCVLQPHIPVHPRRRRARVCDQAADDLVGNAVESTPRGVRVTLAVGRMDGDPRPTNTDTGIGVPTGDVAEMSTPLPPGQQRPPGVAWRHAAGDWSVTQSSDYGAC